MLSIGQKESILRKEGNAVPSFPNRPSAGRPRDTRREAASVHVHEIDVAYEQAIRDWRSTVEVLYACWLSARP